MESISRRNTAVATGASSQGATLPAFTEHRVQDAGGGLYVRDFPGSGPAFVLLLHGFPNNAHIYDDLIRHLAAAGRRTIAFDFLGFGASDSRRAPSTLSNSSAVTWKRSRTRLDLRRSSLSATTPAGPPLSTLR